MLAKNRLNRFFGELVPVDFILKGLELRPVSLLVELTNICNANCIYCAYRLMKRKKGIMGWGILKNIVDEFNEIGGGDINLTGVVGEPLIDPDIVDKIAYASSKKNIRNIRFTTNGILLQERDIRKLLTSGIDRITINIGGMDSRSYKVLFQIDAFELVYENIQKIINVNKSLESPIELVIVIKYIYLKDILKNKKYLSLKATGAKIIFDNTYDNWCSKITREDIIGEMELKEPEEKKIPCSILYAGLSVLENGDVTVCCRDLDGELVLGNIMQQSILDIWRGECIKDLRRSFIQSNPPVICKNCSLYDGLKPIKDFHLFKESIKNRY